jgi:hypothetical protein
MNDAERWLMEWHNRNPGATYRCYKRGLPSSYEMLASRVHPGDHVLDLACGDGSLLKMFAYRGVRKAVGIDISTGELNAARTNSGDEAALVRGRAQGLPFPGESFDVVTCHLAFMLMNPVDVVATEIRRVLRTNGRFMAIIGGGTTAMDDCWSRLVDRLTNLVLQGPPIGDRRTRSQNGLRDVLKDYRQVQVDELVMDLSGTPDQIWENFVNTYTFDMLTNNDLASLNQGVRADCQELLRADGTVPCFLRLLMVTATR